MKEVLKSLLIALAFGSFIISCSKELEREFHDPSADCTGAESVFHIALSTGGCHIDLEAELNTESLFSLTNRGNISAIQINSIPNHLIGTFPNPHNPNTPTEVIRNFTVTNNPEVSSIITSGKGWVGGVLFSGVLLETYTAEYFVGSTGQTNSEWNITGFQTTRNLGLDCNNAHVNPRGSYHYHGLPNAYGANLNIEGSSMAKVGIAADGFPIYYKYIVDDSGQLVVAEASYKLKDEPRPGDGISAPEGCHDGTFVQDYEFLEAYGHLDECNGFYGPTPENPSGEYYYVLTETYPSAPLCFAGAPHRSFRI